MVINMNINKSTSAVDSMIHIWPSLLGTGWCQTKPKTRTFQFQHVDTAQRAENSARGIETNNLMVKDDESHHQES